MTPCTFIGQQLLNKVMLGREEDHAMWDRREEVRGMLMALVAEVVGKEWADNRQFINSL